MLKYALLRLRNAVYSRLRGRRGVRKVQRARNQFAYMADELARADVTLANTVTRNNQTADEAQRRAQLLADRKNQENAVLEAERKKAEKMRINLRNLIGGDD